MQSLMQQRMRIADTRRHLRCQFLRVLQDAKLPQHGRDPIIGKHSQLINIMEFTQPLALQQQQQRVYACAYRLRQAVWQAQTSSAGMPRGMVHTCAI